MKTLRPGMLSDEPLIYATWLRSTYYGNSWFKMVPKEVFFENYKKIVAARLASSQVMVCCLEEDPDVVLGYSIFTEDALHWVYVKKAWRGLGIARDLIGGASTATTMTKLGRLANKGRLMFNPFM